MNSLAAKVVFLSVWKDGEKKSLNSPTVVEIRDETCAEKLYKVKVGHSTDYVTFTWP